MHSVKPGAGFSLRTRRVRSVTCSTDRYKGFTGRFMQLGLVVLIVLKLQNISCFYKVKIILNTDGL